MEISRFGKLVNARIQLKHIHKQSEVCTICLKVLAITKDGIPKIKILNQLVLNYRIRMIIYLLTNQSYLHKE